MVRYIYRLIKRKKMIEMKKHVTPGETPAKISVSMIDQDLKDGISKSEMAIKYGIKPWEVDEMFKHPFLKGRRPSRKKALSFVFEDDISTKETGMIEAVEALQEVDPNQVTLEQAIDEVIETVEDAKQELQEAEKAIVDALSPTEYETPEETLLKAAVDTLGDPDEDYELGDPPSFEDTLDLVKEQQEEEELEMDDDTFEL